MKSTVTLTGQIFSKDFWQLIDKAFHDKAPAIRDIEVANIVARTPVDKGALASSVQGDLFDYGQNDLVYLYPNEDQQIEAWGRVYAPYQEGSDLGLSTYTNDPHEMFALVLTDDLQDITDWANGAGRDAADLIGDHAV